MPWLGAGELLNLAAGWAPDDAGIRHRILVAFPGRVCFPADCAFRGERVVFASGYTPFRRTSRGRPSTARSVRADLLTRLADQWPGMGAMPGECARGRR